MKFDVIVKPHQIVGVGSWFAVGFLKGTEIFVSPQGDHNAFVKLMVQENKELLILDQFTAGLDSRPVQPRVPDSASVYVQGAAYIENMGRGDIRVKGIVPDPINDLTDWALPELVCAAGLLANVKAASITLKSDRTNDDLAQDTDGIIEAINRQVDFYSYSASERHEITIDEIANKILRFSGRQRILIGESWVDWTGADLGFCVLIHGVNEKYQCSTVSSALSWLSNSAFCGCDFCTYRYTLQSHPLYEFEVSTDYRYDEVILVFRVPDQFRKALIPLTRDIGPNYDAFFRDLDHQRSAEEIFHQQYLIEEAILLEMWEQEEEIDEFFDEEVLAHEREDPADALIWEDDVDDLLDWYQYNLDRKGDWPQ